MVRVVGALPRRHRHRHRQAIIARVSVSALVASLPLLYVSLLRPPPAALAGDTAFWFLVSNCVIAAIVATADDAGGALFFGSSNNDDDGGPCGRSVVTFAAVNDPAAVVTTKGGGVSCSNPMDLVASSPFLIQAQSCPDVASKPGTRTDLPSHMHVSLSPLHVQRSGRHEAAIEQSTGQNNTAVTVKGHHEEGEEIVARPTPASDGALAEPPETEAWVVPRLVTSKSLPDQELQEEEEAAGEEWPVPLYSRPPDVLAHGKGGTLRRSATDGSKSAAEESEYWQLSDEELNRRVEDFIARFNRQMRLQIEQDAGGRMYGQQL